MDRKARERVVKRGRAPVGQSAPQTAFSYARVETALAQVFGAELLQRTVFRARLKHFRRLGIPSQNPGKGGRVTYSMSDVFQLMVCLELSEFGIDPNLIVKHTQRHWKHKSGFWQTIQSTQMFPGNDFLAVIHAAIMTQGWGEKFEESKTGISYQSEMRAPIYVRFLKEGDFKQTKGEVLLEKLREDGQRVMVFNLSARVRAVEQALARTV